VADLLLQIQALHDAVGHPQCEIRLRLIVAHFRSGGRRPSLTKSSAQTITQSKLHQSENDQ
jgi:hypothetical protein